MKTGGLYAGLVFLVLLSILGDQIGLKVGDWNDPVTVTDLWLYVLAAVFLIMIEIRDAANWIVKQIKG